MDFPNSVVRTVVFMPQTMAQSCVLSPKEQACACVCTKGPQTRQWLENKPEGGRRGCGRVGRIFYSLGGYDPGAAGASSSPPCQPPPPPPPHPQPSLLLAPTLFRGASSFGALVWQSLWGLGSFWETQPAGPAPPWVSVILKTHGSLC